MQNYSYSVFKSKLNEDKCSSGLFGDKEVTVFCCGGAVSTDTVFITDPMWPKQSHGSSFPSSFLVLSTSATALMKIHTTSCRHRLSHRLSLHPHPLSRGNETIWEELGRALLKEKVTEVKEDGYWQTICKFRSGSFHTFKDRSIYLHTSYTNPTFSLLRLDRGIRL